LEGRQVVAIAGGSPKSRAIAAVLQSRVITGLITDEATAKAVLNLAAGGDVRAHKTSQSEHATSKQPKQPGKSVGKHARRSERHA
jgi:hypothetical protein